MVNSNYMASIHAKRFIRLLTLVALLLVIGLNVALANEGLKLNIFPSIGKPVYGVAEFGSSVTDPVSVTVASEAEYQKAGYTRPAFFNTANVRKLGVNRYLVTTSTPVDSANFTLILDVQFKEFRRVYPVEISLQSGQVAANFAPAKEYDQPAKTAVRTVSKPVVAAVAPAVQPSPVSTQAVPQAPVVQQLQPATIYSAPAPQPQIFYPPMQSSSQPVSNGTEQFPFYIVVIALAVLLLLAMFVVVLFMHKNSDSRHQPVQHDQHSMMSDLLKALPSLMGHNQQSQHAQAQAAAVQMPQPWHPLEASPQQPSPQQPHWDDPKPAPVRPAPQRPAIPARVEQAQASPTNESQNPAVQRAPAPRPARPTAPPASPQPANPAKSAGPVNPATLRAQAPTTQPAPAPARPPAQPSAPVQQQPEKAAKPAAASADKSEKLQLAIVYMNMGDEVMARMLLEEIGRDGSEAEKAEAKAILAKMNNPSDRPIIADKNDKIE